MGVDLNVRTFAFVVCTATGRLRRRDRNQSGYSSFRQVRGSAGWAFGVRSRRKL
jgi:hypothetical protein